MLVVTFYNTSFKDRKVEDGEVHLAKRHMYAYLQYVNKHSGVGNYTVRVEQDEL